MTTREDLIALLVLTVLHLLILAITVDEMSPLAADA